MEEIDNGLDLPSLSNYYPNNIPNIGTFTVVEPELRLYSHNVSGCLFDKLELNYYYFVGGDNNPPNFGLIPK